MSFDELSVVDEKALIFDLAGRDPGLDLIAQPLQFLNLLLKIGFIFLFLVDVRGVVRLLPDVLEDLDALLDLLMTAINFTCECGSASGGRSRLAKTDGEIGEVIEDD